MRKLLPLLILLPALLVAADGTPRAASLLGASVGDVGVEVDALGFDEDDHAWSVRTGYRFMRLFRIELAYHDFGGPSGGGLTVDTTGINGSAVGVLPLPGRFELFAKAGYMVWDVELSGPFDDDGADATFGIGAAYDFGKLALRAEFEQFEVERVDELRLISVGVDLRF